MLADAIGVTLVDDPAASLYPMPLTATGKYDVEVCVRVVLCVLCMYIIRYACVCNLLVRACFICACVSCMRL